MEFLQQKYTGPAEHFKDVPGECPTSMHLAVKIPQIPRLAQAFSLRWGQPVDIP